MEFIFELLGNLEDKVVVDIGVGIGFFVFWLVFKVKKVIVVDINLVYIWVFDSLKVFCFVDDV